MVIGYKFSNKIEFLSLKIVSVFANSADSDEISISAAFHLSIHWLQRYQF